MADFNQSTLSLKEQLYAKQEEYKGSEAIFGMTALTNPGYISSSRSIMFTTHLRHAVSPIHPDFPPVFTNSENTTGKYSSGYKKAKSDFNVIKRIYKFENIDSDVAPYALFVYNIEKDEYDVIIKKDIENLTEKNGFQYDNTFLDDLDEGDLINKGSVLYKSTSYDDDMNYGYGKTGTFMYTCDTRTTEDAILIRKRFAQNFLSIESETAFVPLNDNDILINKYGVDNDYKAFPDIGEFVKDKVLCAARRIHNKQIMFSLKKENMKKIFSNDTKYYIDGQVIDINIYSNKTLDEIPDNSFNYQIRKYLKNQNRYYQEIYDFIKPLKDSGKKCSRDVNYLFKKASDILDPNVKYKSNDSTVFNNMIIEFTVKRKVPIYVGQKVTGRYGNKGVISTIVDDDEMPFLENGTPVDICFNTLGVINRLNSFQLYEQSITFICERVKERIAEFTSLKDKADLLFDIIGRFSKKEADAVKIYYKKLSVKEKKEFFDDILKDGIFIHIPPMWEDEVLYEVILKLYEDHTWIKPYSCYIRKFGRTIKIMKPQIIGKMYIMKLKQTSKKGFSARSTGPINRVGIPAKTTRAKNHEELYSDTPVSNADQELNNQCISIDPSLVSKMHMYYRSSPTARRELGMKSTQMYNGFERLDDNPFHRNRNVEELKVFIKCLGFDYEFNEDYEPINVYTDTIESFYDDDHMFIGTELEYEKMKKREEAKNIYNSEYTFVGDSDDYESEIDKLTDALMID